MKNILNLKGIKTLSKKEQKEVTGSIRRYPCTQMGRICCSNSPGGGICDFGVCVGFAGSGGCIWY